ncbi:A/G-specific adenine glycosylase [Candidatus Methylopumilus planktonicus]|uniref:Adenine DNA glycosylase n=1 Tax=Candidatus Methylopumilus planktonicus TaxID=1581557 RepID=A0A0D6EXM0_9PROT|nr:A/G-specific adenine glycosylase [Candidatus Methylopumilus planktonicus]CEZ20236.1 A/G-specific adenine glycosylase [Candidatus Methylopumilus planktonicus]
MKSLADRLITWHAKSGRHHLPWQQSKDPYDVWVSEIMLQQTQVATVINYYHRFMKKFPTIKALADADEEEVMRLWSGLGYYRRARFLHEGAQMIMEEMEGVFPSHFDMMMKIPGIGRSTAGAISAFSFNQKKAILDGNVKRVLSRYFLITQWTGLPKTEKKLWDYAESILPDKNIATYTQALMDLGATICNKKPMCESCPLKKTCLAFQKNKVHLVPTPRPRIKIPTESTHMVIIKHHDEVLLIKRPQGGIWSGLWSLPQYENKSATPRAWIKKNFGLDVSLIEKDLKASTIFTHYKLDITYSILEARSQRAKSPHAWLSLNTIEGAAIPAITKKILLKL